MLQTGLLALGSSSLPRLPFRLLPGSGINCGVRSRSQRRARSRFARDSLLSPLGHRVTFHYYMQKKLHQCQEEFERSPVRIDNRLLLSMSLAVRDNHRHSNNFYQIYSTLQKKLSILTPYSALKSAVEYCGDAFVLSDRLNCLDNIPCV